MTIPSLSTDNPSAHDASRHEQGKYRNHAFTPREGFGTTLRIIWNLIFHKPRTTRPSGAIEVQALTRCAAGGAEQQRLPPGPFHPIAQAAG